MHNCVLELICVEWNKTASANGNGKFPKIPLLTELLLVSHEDHEVLADASTNVTMPGAALAPAAAAAIFAVGSATAR
jgi:hypothetical protein